MKVARVRGKTRARTTTRSLRKVRAMVMACVTSAVVKESGYIKKGQHGIGIGTDDHEPWGLSYRKGTRKQRLGSIQKSSSVAGYIVVSHRRSGRKVLNKLESVRIRDSRCFICIFFLFGNGHIVWILPRG
jgi:hypothetical protein